MVNVQVMGVLNVTPDSFYAGSRRATTAEAIARGLQLVEEGADWIDIGGMSTSRFRNGNRSGEHQEVSEEEELQRTVPVVEELSKRIRVSIDTIRPEVARAAVKAGAGMINDIQGFRDPRMREVAAESGVLACAMHMKGDYVSMQRDTSYPEGIVTHLVNWGRQVALDLEAAGVARERVILDPGICFGKSLEDNYLILRELPKLGELGFPLLVGLSRKSFMGLLLGKPSDELLPATIAMNSAAVLGGASYIRVHDVAAHRDAVRVLAAYAQS